MGTITVQFKGSFGDKPLNIFQAEEGGHALAISRAVEYLSSKMGEAIRLDHKLHDESKHPSPDFGEPPDGE